MKHLRSVYFLLLISTTIAFVAEVNSHPSGPCNLLPFEETAVAQEEAGRFSQSSLPQVSLVMPNQEEAISRAVRLSTSEGPRSRDQQLAAQIASATRRKLRPTIGRAVPHMGYTLHQPRSFGSTAAQASPSTMELMLKQQVAAADVAAGHEKRQQLPAKGSKPADSEGSALVPPQQPSGLGNDSAERDHSELFPARSTIGSGRAKEGTRLSRPGKLSSSRIMRFEALGDSTHQDKQTAAESTRPASAHSKRRARRKSLLRAHSRASSHSKAGHAFPDIAAMPEPDMDDAHRSGGLRSLQPDQVSLHQDVCGATCTAMRWLVTSKKCLLAVTKTIVDLRSSLCFVSSCPFMQPQVTNTLTCAMEHVRTSVP